MKHRPSTCIHFYREVNMELTFYVAGAVAVISTILMLTRVNLVHSLLYMIVSLLAVAVDFFVLGAPFARTRCAVCAYLSEEFVSPHILGSDNVIFPLVAWPETC